MKKMKLYGVCGNPVFHSKSPEIFNHLFKIHKMNAKYLRFLAEDADEILHIYDKLNFSGLNITSPFKSEIFNKMIETSKSAGIVKSVNTIVQKDGNIYGGNTDPDGVIGCLPYGIENDSKCLVIGSGGAARSAIYALQQLQKEVWISNRTNEKAKLLGQKLGVNYFEFKRLKTEQLDFDIVVSTIPRTSIELKLKIGSVFINADYASSEQCDQECDYTNIPGETWLLFQAMKAFEIFTGIQKMPDKKLFEITKKKRKIGKNIILTGLSGSGKTSVGEALAEKLKYTFVDTDKILEITEQMSIDKIISNHGVNRFREIEKELIGGLKNRKKCVIALGGGSVLDDANRKIIKKLGSSVWLYSPITDCLERTHNKPRPLINKDDILNSANSLFEERKPGYTDLADLLIQNRISIANTVDRLGKELESWIK